MADDFKIQTTAHCGFGGWKCPCCGPHKRGKAGVRRAARRALKIADRQHAARPIDENYLHPAETES